MAKRRHLEPPVDWSAFKKAARGIRAADKAQRYAPGQPRKRKSKTTIDTNKIACRVVAGQLRVSLPYHAGFNTQAHNLSGQFDRTSRSWVFPVEQESAVLDTLERLFKVRPSVPHWTGSCDHRFMPLVTGQICILCGLRK